MSRVYTELDLRKLKGQALKDIWHAMIGKPPGIKNTTGLKNNEEIIEAILKGQEDPTTLKAHKVLKHKEEISDQIESMPPKKKETETPKKVKPVAKPTVHSGPIRAIESMEPPLQIQEVQRISLQPFSVGEEMYYLDAKSKKLYANVDGRPGEYCGQWDPTTQQIIS